MSSAWSSARRRRSSSRRSRTSAAWYRDLVVVAAGTDAPVVHADRIAELREDAPGREAGAEGAAAAVRQAWREAEEFNLNSSLLLEALFVRVHRAFA